MPSRLKKPTHHATVYRLKQTAAIILFSSLTLLSGCVGHTYNSPIIDGTLIQHGEPLAGASVSLRDGSREIQKTQTDKNGRFVFSAEGDWFLFIPIGPQDRIISWSISIEQPSGPVELHSEYGIGGVFSGYSHGDRISLLCDTDKLNITDKNTGRSRLACQSTQ